MEPADWTAGRARLWRPFWIGGTGIVALLPFLFLFLIPLALLFPHRGDLEFAATAVVLLLWTLYTDWVAVCIWRCAANVGWRGWFYMARVISPFLFILPWLIILVLALGGPGEPEFFEPIEIAP